MAAPPELPARWAVFRVTGIGVDDKVEALRVGGTNFHGRVILRISVSIAVDELHTSRAVRCYRYRFTHSTVPDVLTLVTCPSGPVPKLATPPPPIVLSSKDEDRLKQILDRIPTNERRDYSVVREHVEATYGTPALVVVDKGKGGDTYVQVTTRLLSPVECLIASLPASGDAKVQYGDRAFCTGG